VAADWVRVLSESPVFSDAEVTSLSSGREKQEALLSIRATLK
jgi:hypothetical protein